MNTEVEPSKLQQSISSWSRPGILVDCRTIVAGDEDSLLETEARSIAQASPLARRASASARIVARALLQRLGLPPAALPKGASSAILWPEGVTGALAHDAEIAVAAVGLMREVRGIGIDIEPAGPLGLDLDALVMTAAERQRTGNDPLQAKLVFVVKEAIYKALNPIDGRFLEYHDISVDLPGQRAITRHGRALEIRTCVSSHLVALALI